MKEDTVERIPQHRHCLTCGRAFTGGGDYCSEACENGKKDEIKSKRNKLIIIWVIAVIMMVFAYFFVE